MKDIIKKQKGITMVSLVITVIILLILTNVLIYNAKDSIYINSLTNLYNDIELLDSKISEYYEEKGKIPAKIKYTNISNLSNVISKNNDTGEFYVIDLQEMQGITLNYGKDYEKIKNDTENANKYTDVYIINKNSHNIFYVQGVSIEEKGETNTYYTTYTKPDETIVDLRYIDGILIPDGYYYIGKEKDEKGNENIVISKNIEEKIGDSENQYIWEKYVSILEKMPDKIKLSEEQNQEEFIKSVECYKGYFKNKNKTEEIDVVYQKVEENNWSEQYTKNEIYTDKNGDTAYIPKGFRVSLAEGTNEIINGLVITDQIKENGESTGNEFVWIPVDDSDEFVREDFETNPTDEKIFITTKPTENRYFEETIYGATNANEAEEMYRSIKEYKGFYIGRYETGIEENTARTVQSDISTKAVIKKNKYIYNYIQWGNGIEDEKGGAVEKSRELYENSTLCYGVQWDAIMKWIGKDSNTKNVLTDSTGFGNYNTEGNLIKTGNYEEYKIKNIYDLAGNVEEWTMETFGTTYKVARGGKSGSNEPIYYRQENQVDTKSGTIGFRIALYIK